MKKVCCFVLLIALVSSCEPSGESERRGVLKIAAEREVETLDPRAGERVGECDGVSTSF